MEFAVLENKEMKATFSPLHGMNLMSLTRGGVEVIDLKTKPLFEERCAGLGSLIGPHFHHRPLSQIPKVPREDLFPHIAKLKAKGVLEPFSHGIGRYAPWKANVFEDRIEAKLSGNDLWNGVFLKDLEGFNFEMEFQANLLEKGISLDFSILSEKPSVLGFHYYYTLPLEGGQVMAEVEDEYRVNDEWVPLPSSFLDEKGFLVFDGKQECDFGFIPKENFVLYQTREFSLKISFEGASSFQLYRPKDATYLCIEPLSARDPKHPTQLQNRIKVQIDFV